MITQNDLKLRAEEKLADAIVLLGNSRFDGAVYIAGYAIELALKSKICLTLNWSDFPSAGREFDGLTSLKTHDLNILLRLSGFETTMKTTYLYHWNNVNQWQPEIRYKAIGTYTVTEATEVINSTRNILSIL